MSFNECDEHLGIIQNSLKSVYGRISSLNGISHETKGLFSKLKKIVDENLSVLKNLRAQSQKLVEDKIQSKCDQEMLVLQLQTVEEQLKLHIKHSGTDQDMLLKMMAEIESLKEEKCDLSERLQQELKNNERGKHLMNDQRNDNLSKTNEDKERFVKTIQRYQCKLLALEAVIECMRRRGIQIPIFPKVQRKEKSIGVSMRVGKGGSKKKMLYEGTKNEKQNEKMEEFMKEIEYLRNKNEASFDKQKDLNDIMLSITRHLEAQERVNEALEAENMGMKKELKDEAILRSNIGRSKVFRLALLVAFVVGVTHRKKGSSLMKIYL